MRKCLLIWILVVGAGVGCGSDDEPVDPTGNWDLRLTFGGGDCGIDGATVDMLWTVTEAAENSYVLQTSLSEGLQSIDGTFRCDPDTCNVSALLVYEGSSDGSPYTERDSYNLVLDSDGFIEGTGSAQIIGTGFGCTQAFDVTGVM